MVRVRPFRRSVADVFGDRHDFLSLNSNAGKPRIKSCEATSARYLPAFPLSMTTNQIYGMDMEFACRGAHRGLEIEGYVLMKSSRSALITSACVVHIPCGNFS